MAALDYENIAKSPTFWVIVILLILIPVAFWFGTVKSREWADSEYLQDRIENEKKINQLEQSANDAHTRADTFAKENAGLKFQNEAQAEILKANDEKLRGDAKKLDELNDKRNQKNEEIANTPDADNNCAACADFERAGFPLNNPECRRCKATP